jgi:hypothetical protein
MSKDTRPIEVGDRFESKDRRDGGRIVEVVESLGLSDHGEARMARARSVGHVPSWSNMTFTEFLDWIRAGETNFRIKTEVHPNNPSAVGRTIRIQENTLREKFTRVSR